MNAGRLIALEGLDGCGKSTQQRRLVAALRRAGLEVCCTHEPTDGPHGRRIREMARSGQAVAPERELAWFVEDRREHVRDTIGPALAAGEIVITDRYFLSSVAYQGARGLDWARILAESEVEFPAPDLVLLLEIDPAIGLERVRARGGRLEPAFEQLAFQERVSEIFRAVDRPYVERIDAAPDADTVHAEVMRRVGRRLALAGALDPRSPEAGET